MAVTWQDVAQDAQRRRDDSISQVKPPLAAVPTPLPDNVLRVPHSVLSREEIDITETPIGELLTALAAGKVTAVSATNAFLRRAALAQRLTNCVFELVPVEALARARELDAMIAGGEQPVGPLHGLPVSIKARIPWKGLRNTEGFVASLHESASEDATITSILRGLGAIPYARTTEPQALMMLENISNIHGSTGNPYNTSLSPGGSSGGEGALLALHASPLGVGSDIGGSLRSPAANCGIYTLKPSVGRLPTTGLRSFMSGCETVLGVIGPMSPHREAISIFMKSVLDTQPWLKDPLLLPIPWRKLEDFRTPTLNIGIMWEDGVVTPSKSMTRALQMVHDNLQSNPRFKVTRWEPYKQAEALQILERLYSPDGGDAFKRALARSGEPALELTTYRLLNGPGIEKLDTQSYWNWTKARDVFRYNYLQEWNSKAPEMHVILCPPHPSAAPPIGTSKYWGYTSLWNLLDYSAAIFPVTEVDPVADAEDATYSPRNEIDAWCHSHFDASRQSGLPVSLQLVGKRLEEEKVVMAMEAICEALKLPFAS